MCLKYKQFAFSGTITHFREKPLGLDQILFEILSEKCSPGVRDIKILCYIIIFKQSNKAPYELQYLKSSNQFPFLLYEKCTVLENTPY